MSIAIIGRTGKWRMRAPIVAVGLALAGLLAAIAVTDAVPATSQLLYDANPEHLWNRIDHHFRIRTASDGTKYGADAVDPLLWRETRHLLDGPSHATALKLLDEFLATNAERLVMDSVRRALLQRDLWAVFDWTVSHFETHAAARHELARRLAPVIRSLALTREQLPQLVFVLGRAGPKMLDPYAAAVNSKRFPARYDSADRARTFLPPDLVDEGGPWVPIQGNTPLAQHTDEMSRSWFAVFLNLPGGRAATLAYLRVLWDAPQPFVVDDGGSFGGEKRTMIAPALRVVPPGTQVALVRKMLLIGADGEIHYSNLVESVQLRVFRDAEQDFFEVVFDRAALIRDPASALRAVKPSDQAFLTFSAHGVDPFEQSAAIRAGRVLDTCRACHAEPGLASILSARRLFKPYTFAERGRTMLDGSSAFWKTWRADWGYLRALWQPR